MRLSAGMVAEFSAKPLQGGRRRDHNLALAARLHHLLGQIGELIVLDRLRQESICQFGGGASPKGAKAKSLLAFDRLTLTGPLRGQILVDGVRKNPDLVSDERKQGGRRSLAGAQRTTGEAQVAEHERMAEAVVIAAAASDRDEVSSGQCEMTHQLTRLRRWVKQLCDLGFAQSLSSCHSCLLGLDAGRPSDPGQGVD